jgi:hypothetical protein
MRGMRNSLTAKGRRASYGVPGCWRGRVQFLEVVVVPVGLTPGWMFYHAIVASFRKVPYGRHSEAALLTICSQTVRILLDVPAHVGGKAAGQADNAGHVCMSGAGWPGSIPALCRSSPSEPPVGSILCRVIA